MAAKPKICFMLGSHMDLFWMGPTRDCLDRGCDIINRALELCQKHREYVFYIESTVFAEYYLKNFPEKKALLKQLIDDERVEIGASYIDRFEHYHGGESIVRHHIYGKYFLEDALDYSPRGTCHSDLPGLSPQVPQICALSEIDYYIRARGPMGVYRWSAPDKTEILYVSVGYSYGKATEKRMRREADNIVTDREGKPLPAYVMRGGYSDLEMCDEEILDAIKAFREEYPQYDFELNVPGSALAPYKASRDMLPEISGEWPVGWASTSAANQDTFRLDHIIENRLLSLEKLAVLSALSGKTLRPEDNTAEWWTIMGRIKGEIKLETIAPGQELFEAWKAEMYTHDHNYYGFGGYKTEMDKRILKQHVMEYMDAMQEKGMANLFGGMAVPDEIGGKRVLYAVAVFNPSAFDRDCAVRVALPQTEGACTLTDADGNRVAASVSGNEALISAGRVPSVGWKLLYAVADEAPMGPQWACAVHAEGGPVLETARYRVVVNEKTGTLSSLFDKKLGRELIDQASGDGFLSILGYGESGSNVVYGFTGENRRDDEMAPKATLRRVDELCADIEIETRAYGCRFLKTVRLYRDSDDIQIKVEFWWNGEKNQSVRLCLPFAQTGYEATQYGVPYHSMRFPGLMKGIDDDVILGVGDFNPDEVDANSRYHIREVEKWMDLMYGDYGITVTANVTNYWMDGARLEPVLLRTGVSCGDPKHMWIYNYGYQHLEYVLRPHTGDWVSSGAYRKGWGDATEPMARVVMPQVGDCLPAECAMFSVDSRDVIVSAIKPAYKSGDEIVLRLFETHGIGGSVNVTCPMPIEACSEVNLLERADKPAAFHDNVITAEVRPHEIKNLKIRFRKSK